MQKRENILLRFTNCVLIGFMGSGKSTIARELHKQSGALLLDSDLLIAFSQNLSIPMIFEQYGEKYFRDLEEKFCTNIAKNVQNSIIATGGGMPIFCDVKSMGRVFFLHLEFEDILARLDAKELENRPLFKNKESAFMLYKERLEAYQKSADYTINGNQSVAVITQEILGLL